MFLANIAGLCLSGASACIQLKKFDEANTWCEKGLAVSFTGIDIFVVISPKHSFNVEKVSFVSPVVGLSTSFGCSPYRNVQCK